MTLAWSLNRLINDGDGFKQKKKFLDAVPSAKARGKLSVERDATGHAQLISKSWFDPCDPKWLRVDLLTHNICEKYLADAYAWVTWPYHVMFTRSSILGENDLLTPWTPIDPGWNFGLIIKTSKNYLGTYILPMKLKKKTNYFVTNQVVWAFRKFCFLQFDTKFASKTREISQDWHHFVIVVVNPERKKERKKKERKKERKKKEGKKER